MKVHNADAQNLMRYCYLIEQVRYPVLLTPAEKQMAREDFIEVNGEVFWKPFVEKPVNGELSSSRIFDLSILVDCLFCGYYKVKLNRFYLSALIPTFFISELSFFIVY